jgi:Phage integrase family
MAKVKVRYLVEKRLKSRVLYYWQPTRGLREAGFEPRRLAERTNDLADAVREAEALNRKLDAWRAGRAPVPLQPGTLPWLVRLYRADERYTGLAALTQKGYDQHIRALEAWSARAGNPPLATISRKACQTFYRSMASTPAAATAVLRVLRILLGFAVDEGELERNPAERMRLRTNPPRDQVWKPEQIDTFVAAAEAKGRPSIGLAVRLGEGLGQREGDTIRLSWTAYNGAVVRLRQRKTGKLIDVPVIDELREALDQAPRTATTIVASETTGRPYSEHNFGTLFREIATAAGLPPELQYRDLRRTAVVRLAEAGCSVPEIAAITGHSLRTANYILEVYCPRNTTMAQHAIARLEDYRERTQGQRKLEDS